jgi:hypothetical protein
MEINAIVDNLIRKVAPKYQVSRDQDSPTYRWPTPAGTWEKSVLILNRTPTVGAGKTLLLASSTPSAHVEEILMWCAYAKGNLPDPESADLYLFLIYDDPIPDLDSCLQIEADELYCRKYLLRPNERLDDLLNRSFLSEPGEASAGQQRSDPLKQALLDTAANYSWLNGAEIDRWREILLSDNGGYELAHLLYQPPAKND